MEPEDAEKIAACAHGDRYLYRQRLYIQRNHRAQAIGQGRTIFHPENIPLLRAIISMVLKGTGLYWRGRKNARDIRIVENHVALPNLPRPFRGFRLLHLSDLHSDIDPAITSALIGKLRNLSCDATVLTGDYRNEVTGDFAPALHEIRRIVPFLPGPVIAIPGNHDAIEQTPRIEETGIRMLLNENMYVEKTDPESGETARLYFAGIDDPHFYCTDNLEKALDGIPEEATAILLSHSAEPWEKARGAKIPLLLCGHTHGGQICLPGGFPIIHNVKHSRSMDRGSWRRGSLRGYTSPGVGCSILPVRYFCAPEMTVHVLECG
jgi:uncharacterized protein